MTDPIETRERGGFALIPKLVANIVTVRDAQESAMEDPIDWPAFGMPEGVEILYRDKVGRHEWAAAEGCSWFVYYIEDPGFDISYDGTTQHFPILEAFMRAARAIEAGEVQLSTDSP